jgi:FkbM family methyltransferase
MAANSLVNLIKRALPAPVLHIVRRIRTPKHRPDAEIAELRKRHLSYQPADPNEITLRPGLTLRIDPESRYPFEHFCFRSPEMTCELDRFIKNAAAFSSFVDVGANHGIFSLTFCALRSHGRVVAIDPSPIAFEILQNNLNLNSFSQAQARKIACGAAPGEVRMKPNWHHLQAIRDEDNDVDAVAVPMLSLDQICKEENIAPELLKIDVEGFELPVLQGGERVLQSANLLFLEVHPLAIDELRLSRPAIFDLLTGSGWSGYTLKDGRLTREDFAAQTDIFWTMWRKC